MVIVALACFAPWAFGSVDAWAQLVLFGGVALATILGVVADRGWGGTRRLLCVPSVALAGLVLLAVVQAAPVPEGLLGWIAPERAAVRDKVLPETPERVVGETGWPVLLPRPTLSVEPDATLHVAAQLAAAWLLFQAVMGLKGGFGAMGRFGAAIAANATLLALFSLIQALSWNGRIYWIGPYGNTSPWSGGGPFVCHSHLAEYLNLGLGFALGFLIGGDRLVGRQRRGGRVWAAYAAGAIVVGIVTSHSRGGFLAMLGAMAATLALMRVRSAWAGAGVAAMLGVVGLFLYVLGDASPYAERISTIWGSDEGYTSRTNIWAGALRAWQDHPVWGTGFGSFAVATPRYLGQDYGLFFARAENEYVDILTEGGLIGLGLALAAAVGIGMAARRALATAPSARDRALVLGGIFGLVAIALHSMSDFGLHVPGVAVPVVILSAHMCRLGLRERGTSPGGSGIVEATPKRRGGRVVGGLAASALALVLVAHGVRDARVEALLAEGDLPPPGAEMPTAADLDATEAELSRMKTALEAALRLRPDWTEGHLRLGMVRLGLYEREAAALIGDAVPEQAAAIAADPLRLFALAHDDKGDTPVEVSELLAYKPVRDALVPAARSFLEARRCCPVVALSHAKLAGLDYLLEGGDPASVYVRRALLLAGNDSTVIHHAALVAALAGDFDLAARAWRRALEVDEARWAAVADTAAATLSPEQILESVVPDGRYALLFADRLYPDPEQRTTRDAFLRAAIERLPHDRDLEPAERLWLEAQAWDALDRPGPARDRMEAALALEPLRSDWRRAFIDGLLRWGQYDEAHDQALIWVHLAPDTPAAREALDRAAEALARGEGSP